MIIMGVCYLSAIAAFLYGHRLYCPYPVFYTPGKMSEKKNLWKRMTLVVSPIGRVMVEFIVYCRAL